MSVRILLAVTLLVVLFPFAVFLRPVEADPGTPQIIRITHCGVAVMYIWYNDGKVSLATPSDLAMNESLMKRLIDTAKVAIPHQFPVEAVSGIGCPVKA